MSHKRLVLYTYSKGMSFPQSRKLSGVGNPSEKPERFRTSRNDKVKLILSLLITFDNATCLRDATIVANPLVSIMKVRQLH